MKPENKASLHVDMDSPKVLLRFWGLKDVPLSQDQLNEFYARGMERAVSLFRECGVVATFFCTGDELETSEKIRAAIRAAFKQGHEIANHSYGHLCGLSKLPRNEIIREIDRCSEVIRQTTGESPRGFRAPSYDVSNDILNLLEERGFEYDCSAFWSLLNPLIKSYYQFFRKEGGDPGFGQGTPAISRDPYFPSEKDWTRKGPVRKILEIPFPRTRFLHLPFYNNFHLSSGSAYRKWAVSSFDRPYFAYLFHLIEFVDLKDPIPAELAVHPNLKIPLARKLDVIRDTISRIRKNYRVVKTVDFVQEFKSGL